MEAYSLIIILFAYCICQYASFKIMPELKKNILNFVYGINFEGMLAHSFDWFYVFPKFILLSVKDFRFSTINFDETCNYLKEKNGCDHNFIEYMSVLRLFCKKQYHLYIIIECKFLLIITSIPGRQSTFSWSICLLQEKVIIYLWWTLF